MVILNTRQHSVPKHTHIFIHCLFPQNWFMIFFRENIDSTKSTCSSSWCWLSLSKWKVSSQLRRVFFTKIIARISGKYTFCLNYNNTLLTACWGINDNLKYVRQNVSLEESHLPVGKMLKALAQQQKSLYMSSAWCPSWRILPPLLWASWKIIPVTVYCDRRELLWTFFSHDLSSLSPTLPVQPSFCFCFYSSYLSSLILSYSYWALFCLNQVYHGSYK